MSRVSKVGTQVRKFFSQLYQLGQVKNKYMYTEFQKCTIKLLFNKIARWAVLEKLSKLHVNWTGKLILAGILVIFCGKILIQMWNEINAASEQNLNKLSRLIRVHFSYWQCPTRQVSHQKHQNIPFRIWDFRQMTKKAHFSPAKRHIYMYSAAKAPGVG